MNPTIRPGVRRLLTVSAALCASVLAGVAAEPSLNPHLEPFRPLLGTTWKGAFKNSKPDKPMADVARWERALNGQAVRLLHSVNDGLYGGETIFFWDEKVKAIVSYYFTTAGHMTRGKITAQDGKFLSEEEVQGSEEGGVTKVRATTELTGETMHVKAEYFKANEWKPGHEITYRPDPAAQVNFK